MLAPKLRELFVPCIRATSRLAGSARSDGQMHAQVNYNPWTHTHARARTHTHTHIKRAV